MAVVILWGGISQKRNFTQENCAESNCAIFFVPLQKIAYNSASFPFSWSISSCGMDGAGIGSRGWGGHTPGPRLALARRVEAVGRCPRGGGHRPCKDHKHRPHPPLLQTRGEPSGTGNLLERGSEQKMAWGGRST